jgi:hypothetical protein
MRRRPTLPLRRILLRGGCRAVFSRRRRPLLLARTCYTPYSRAATVRLPATAACRRRHPAPPAPSHGVSPSQTPPTMSQLICRRRTARRRSRRRTRTRADGESGASCRRSMRGGAPQPVTLHERAPALTCCRLVPAGRKAPRSQPAWGCSRARRHPAGLGLLTPRGGPVTLKATRRGRHGTATAAAGQGALRAR